MLNRAYLGLGSNFGDGKRILQDAWEELGILRDISLVTLSSPYVTAPVGMASNHWFVNGVGALETALKPLELLEVTQAIETLFGRKKDRTHYGYQDRSLDVDILFFNNIVLDDPDLTIPHPHLHRRLFALAPLAEIAPELIHPSTGLTCSQMEKKLVQEMQDGLIDKQEVLWEKWIG